MSTATTRVIPDWLRISQPLFESIYATLSEREATRRDHAAACLAVARGRQLPAGFTLLTGYSTSVGSSKENLSKNRYRDIIAYDRTRIMLPANSAGMTEGEYINASLILQPDLGIEGALRDRYWVAAQAPIPSTIHAFLSLLLVSPRSPSYPSTSAALPPVNIILQVTPLVESGKRKCEPYFPSTIDDVWNFPSQVKGERGVFVKLIKKERNVGWRSSRIQVGWEGTKGREIVHVEYENWGDHGVPTDSHHLLDFIKTIDSLNAALSTSSSLPPILIHCSAGVGRTGTYIALSALAPLLSQSRSYERAGTAAALRNSQLLPPYALPSGSESTGGEQHHKERDLVALTVDGLREQRTTMVQTREQLRWIYEALVTSLS